MNKRPATTFLGAAIAASLLVSPVLADAPIDYADIKALRPAPLVTNATPDAPVPADQKAAFGKRLAEAKELLKGKDRARGISASEAVIRDFAAYPGLVRQMRATAARALESDKATIAKACAFYDALIAETGRPTAETTRWLRQKQKAVKKLGLFEETNEVLLRLLAQPDIQGQARFYLAFDIASHTGHELKDYKAGVELASAIARDKTYDLGQRHHAFRLAKDYANRFLKDGQLVLGLHEDFLKNDGLSAEMRAEIVRDLIGLYYGVKPEPRAAEAHALARSYYTDAKNPADLRNSVFIRALNHRYWSGKKDVFSLYAADAKTLLEEAGAAMKPRERATLEDEIFELHKRFDNKSDAFEEAAMTAFSNTNNRSWRRVAAASSLSWYLRGKDRDDEASAICRKALPIDAGNIGLIGGLLGQLVEMSLSENDLEKSIAVCNEGLLYNRTAAMTNKVADLVTDVYVKFRDLEKAYEHNLSIGRPVKAADVLSRHLWVSAPEKAMALYKKTILDDSATTDERRRAYRGYYRGIDSKEEMAFADQHFDAFAHGIPSWTNNVLSFLRDQVRGMGCWAFNGEFDKVASNFDRYEKVADAAGKPYDFEIVQYSAYAFSALGRTDRAASICKKAVAQEEARRKPFESFRLAIFGDLLDARGDHATLMRAIAEADKRHGSEVSAKERVEAIEHLGIAANLGDREDLIRALDAYRDALYVPQPKKRYVVEYSDKPLLSVADWDKLAKKPVEQKMDRSYGGNMDFLATDVSTGDRGEGIAAGEAKDDAARPTFSAVCDAQGLHLRFVAPDKRAREVESGFLGAGSYEGYIAPGANQPYVCLLLELQNGKLGLWNTTYDTTGHRRIEDKDLSAYRTQTYFTDDSIVSYLMLSWENYATLIPSDGTIWEFENVLWGREGNAAWNGTESIHGRSTWGELEFRLPEKGRIEILKRVIFQVMKDYNAEKKCSHTHQGCIDLWQDTALGDPAFYEAKAKPLVEKLDAYLPLVKVDMSDADVLRVAEEALPGWRDIRYTVARLRQQWLAEELSRSFDR